MQIHSSENHGAPTTLAGANASLLTRSQKGQTSQGTPPAREETTGITSAVKDVVLGAMGMGSDSSGDDAHDSYNRTGQWIGSVLKMGAIIAQLV